MLQPHQLAALTIDPAAIGRVPESVARSCCVLPVAFQNGRLHLILPNTVDDPGDSTLDRLNMVLESEFTYDTAPRDQLHRFVDLHHWAAYSEIENCDVHFRFKCPKQWADLQPTNDKLVRHCDVCEKDVFYCYTKDELQERASKNQCVAFNDYGESPMTLGLPDQIPPPDLSRK
jgi:hypothetical protein